MTSDDPYAGVTGRFYSFYIARPRIGRLVGRLLWGSDFAPLYASLTELGGLRPGSVVVDVACGAGLALGWLAPGRGIRYVGIDNSPSMIGRARRQALQRGLDDVEFLLGDVHSLPLRDRLADACLLYSGLQAFAQVGTPREDRVNVADGAPRRMTRNPPVPRIVPRRSRRRRSCNSGRNS